MYHSMSEPCRVARIRASRGLTLIEIFVVIIILGILCGLLIPSVHAAREAARRAQCNSHLKQIGIAMNTYESSIGMFPPGFMSAQPPKFRSKENYLSNFVQLLPYLEQNNLYSHINFTLSYLDRPSQPIVENRTVRSTRLNMLLCPSDWEQNHNNSYRFNWGRRRTTNLWQPYDGPFGIGFLTTSAAVSDGLSQTAFVSERLGGSFSPLKPDVTRDMKIPNDWPEATMPNDDVYINYCFAAPAKAWRTDEGRYWYYWGASFTAYNHNGPPNSPAPACGGQIFGHLPPNSLHNHYVHVLFGDGHVTSVSDSINLQLWRSMGTHDSGD